MIWFVIILSALGSIGIGFAAATKFVWWQACLWGFFSCPVLFAVGVATWGIIDALEKLGKETR